VSSLRSLARQPVVYFVLIGAGTFFADGWLRRRADEVHVSDAVRKEVAGELQGVFGRPPNEAELARGVQDWIDTELLFREASSLGLHENDAVIRMHLANKLKFVVRQRTLVDAPTEAELAARLDANRDRYTKPDTYAVTQVFFNQGLSPGEHDARVREARARLEAGASAEGMGDHFPRGYTFTQLTRLQLEQIFSTALSDVLQPAQLNRWQVVTNRRGTHLIRVDAIVSGQPDLNALRQALAADVEAQKREAAVRTFTEALRKKYAVDVGTAE
jgi:PPIC-type PPIASE domain